ncbi:hypothetical protein BJV74DRAFT_335471 [Russula compacta]|nr:hypothetical protein BJV74DRAFT_335471 [Russula compacta]
MLEMGMIVASRCGGHPGRWHQPRHPRAANQAGAEQFERMNAKAKMKGKKKRRCRQAAGLILPSCLCHAPTFAFPFQFSYLLPSTKTPASMGAISLRHDHTSKAVPLPVSCWTYTWPHWRVIAHWSLTTPIAPSKPRFQFHGCQGKDYCVYSVIKSF